jgi:sugar/nucleoside kinase (ribokinase family)
MPQPLSQKSLRSLPFNRSLDVLVIGGASLDVLHFAGQTAASAGGAGLYTALAAHCAGAKAGMFAPRPDPMPAELEPAAQRLAWLGPIVPPEQLPRFEIAHHGGGRATLVNATWGAESQLTPNMLPSELRDSAIVHIAALRTAERQLMFAQACRAMGRARLSAGTYGRSAAGERDLVRQLFESVDLFFMNENEANLLFGHVEAARARPGQVLFVTLGERGALVIQGEYVTHVPGVHGVELDPTGAGDTFCGATLAGLARSEHPVMAARGAVTLAAEMIGQIGPTRLVSDQPATGVPTYDRCRPNAEQIRRVAQLVARLPEVQPFSFTGDLFPPAGDPWALDFFFAAVLQQFGFWETHDGHYDRPLIASIEGRRLKGSDYVWRAYRRQLDQSPQFLAPARQAELEAKDLAKAFQADDGTNPMPAFDLHLDVARAYGHDMSALAWTAADVVGLAQSSERPRTALLDLLTHIGGYKEDPLRKKAMLLCLILEQRPERFLVPAPGEPEPPVIDYHLMRSCLRIGLIDLHDDVLRRRVIAREELPSGDEWAIRRAAYRAIQQVQQQSARYTGAVDWFFFGARQRCPEMTEPDCEHCAVNPACFHRKELFQPVMRTTFY